MPKVEALNNFPYDGRMRTKGEQFDLRDDELNLHLEHKRVKVVSNTRTNSPVTNNRQLEGGVDKTTVTREPAPPPQASTDTTEKKPAAPMTTQDVSGRDLVANQTAARRASGKVSNAGSTAAPAGASSPKAGKNEDGSPSKQ